MAKLKAKRIKAVKHDHDYSNIFYEVEETVEEKQAYQNLKAKFAHVRKLIKLKRYNDARYELTRINHIKADEWLRKLNQLDPNYSERNIIFTKNLVIVAIVLFLLGLVFFATRSQFG